MDYNKQELLKNFKLYNLYNETIGLGNVSKTLNKVILGIFDKGKWLGEESIMCKGQVPHLYSAVCLTDVKVLAIHVQDFMVRFPVDIKKAFEDMTFQKFY